MIEPCFGYKHGTCQVLIEQQPCDNCPFYKSKSQAKADRQAVMEHIRSLLMISQLHISDKYFGGEMPWMA